MIDEYFRYSDFEKVFLVITKSKHGLKVRAKKKNKHSKELCMEVELSKRTRLFMVKQR